MVTTGHMGEVPQRCVELAIAVIVIILNITEIHFISTVNRQAKIYELLLLSLSASDLLFGLSSGILCIIYLTDHTKYEIFEITYTTSFYFVLTSIFSLSWIALDRLWAVCWPFSHNYHVTRRRTYIVIAVTWTFTTAASVFVFLYHEITETYIIENKKTQKNFTTAATVTAKFTKSDKCAKPYELQVQLALTIFILLSYVIFGCCYGYLICNFKRYMKRIKTTCSNVHQNDNVHQNVLKVCVLIATTFITFTLPFTLTHLIIGKVPAWASLVLIANSAINSVVYCYPTHWIKVGRRFKRTIRPNIEMRTLKKNMPINSDVSGTQVMVNTSV